MFRIAIKIASNKYPKHTFLEVSKTKTIFLYNFQLTITSRARFRAIQAVIIRTFCRSIERRYKEGTLYINYSNRFCEVVMY